jgi:hypothetical protein
MYHVHRAILQDAQHAAVDGNLSAMHCRRLYYITSWSLECTLLPHILTRDTLSNGSWRAVTNLEEHTFGTGICDIFTTLIQSAEDVIQVKPAREMTVPKGNLMINGLCVARWH